MDGCAHGESQERQGHNASAAATALTRGMQCTRGATTRGQIGPAMQRHSPCRSRQAPQNGHCSHTGHVRRHRHKGSVRWAAHAQPPAQLLDAALAMGSTHSTSVHQCDRTCAPQPRQPRALPSVRTAASSTCTKEEKRRIATVPRTQPAPVRHVATSAATHTHPPPPA